MIKLDNTINEQKYSDISFDSMGVFTVIAHRAAGATAALGTIFGGLAAIASLLSGDGWQFLVVVISVVFIWVSVSGLGTLAEISIKISRLDGSNFVQNSAQLKPKTPH